MMWVSASQLQVGENHTEIVFEDLSRTQLVMYAGASGDYNPLHTDDRFTTEVAGFPSVFAHGMLTMGASGRLITDWFGVDAVKRYSARFVNQVWPGDRLTATVTVDSISEDGDDWFADLSLVTLNADENKVMTGTAVVRLRP